jgi:hypothetical protein
MEPSEILDAAELDDDRDRDELRSRYGMLLQELRVLLPGVQLLVAFLLTAPFAQGFDRVDQFGRVLYGVALTAGLLSVLAFTTPIALHRFGERSARSARLVLSIKATRTGIVFLGISLLSAFSVIARLVYGPVWASLMIGLIAVGMALSWIVLPQLVHHRVVPAEERSKRSVGPTRSGDSTRDGDEGAREFVDELASEDPLTPDAGRGLFARPPVEMDGPQGGVE